MKCHNCGEAHKFSTVLRRLDPALYNEYKLDCLRESGSPTYRKQIVPEAPLALPKATLDGLPSIASLDPNHLARTFVVKRKLPIGSWNKLFYTENWTDWVHAQNWDYEYQEKGVPRLLMPCYNIQGGVMMVQSRTLLPEANSRIRYMTAKAHSEVPKVYGLERWDVKKRTYVVEGPLDSWFLPNCLAAMGSELGQVPDRIPTYDVPDWVFVPDCEPRNIEILKQINRLVDENYPVCLLPPERGCKDLNDFILSGMTQNELLEMVNKHTYDGLKLQLEFQRWKKR